MLNIKKFWTSKAGQMSWRWALGILAMVCALSAGNYAVAQLNPTPAAKNQEMAQLQAPTLPRAGTPAQAPISRAPPEIFVDAAENSPQDGQAKLASIKGSCWCEFSCQSSCGGNLNPGLQSIGGSLWQHLESNRQECKNRCDNAMDAAVNAWSAKGQITCTGTSWVGTNTGKAKPVSYTTNKGACQPGPDGQGTACCPPIQKGQVSPLFERLANGPVSAPYALNYVPSAAFDQKMIASATLGGFNGGCSPITVTHTMRNMTASGTPVVATVSVSYTSGGAGAPVYTGSWSGLAINTTYKVFTTVSCPAGVRGYYSDNCPQRSFEVAWIFAETRMMPGTVPPASAARPQVTEVQ
jgi:hypothetical protein